MQIRTAQLRDLPMVLQLFRRFYADTHCEEIDGLSIDALTTTQSFTSLATNPRGSILLAVDREEVVGVLALQAGPQFFCKEIVVTELFWYVTPEARGQGLSSILLDHAEDWARSIHATHVLMGLHRSSPAVARLSYEKRGYIESQTAYMKRL